MKKILILSLLFVHLTMSAVEKIYISTDKQVYMAGSDIWYSLYCVDINNNTLSPLSKISYLELHSSQGLISTHKSTLQNGRGCGRISISPNLATGNYTIVAYTSISPDDKDLRLYRKHVTILNSFSTDVVEDNVVICHNDSLPNTYPNDTFSTCDMIKIDHQDKTTSLSKESKSSFRITNNGDHDLHLSVSIFYQDTLIFSEHNTIFKDGVDKVDHNTSLLYNHLEYEGEIITVELENFSTLIGNECFISSIGSNKDTYASVISPEGTSTFVTNNIFDSNELYLSVIGDEGHPKAKIRSPFRNVHISDIPKLYLPSSVGSRVNEKGVRMQIEKRYGIDTLTTKFHKNERSLLHDNSIIYKLDDYTRFPVMEELFIEYIYDARVRKEGGAPLIQVRCDDIYDHLYFSSSSLVLLDGVPIFKHSDFLDYDPHLIKEIRIHTNRYIISGVTYEGVVEAITYKGNAPGFIFSNTSILPFISPSWPVSYTGERLIIGDPSTPDFRETIYWHPIITIPKGSSFMVDYITPSYIGNFRIIIEGMTSEGEMLFFSDIITVL